MRKIFYKVIYQNKEYILDEYKTKYFISRLSNLKMEEINEENLNELLEKYDLFDNVFLENISVYCSSL